MYHATICAWRYISHLTKAGILSNPLGANATTLIYHILIINKSNNYVVKLLKVKLCKKKSVLADKNCII